MFEKSPLNMLTYFKGIFESKVPLVLGRQASDLSGY